MVARPIPSLLAPPSPWTTSETTYRVISHGRRAEPDLTEGVDHVELTMWSTKPRGFCAVISCPAALTLVSSSYLPVVGGCSSEAPGTMAPAEPPPTRSASLFSAFNLSASGGASLGLEVVDPYERHPHGEQFGSLSSSAMKECGASGDAGS